EMYAVVVEAVPALTLGAFAVAVEIGLSQALVDEVVLAWNIVHVEVCFADQLGGVVELIGLGKVGDVTRMDHEGGLWSDRFHLGNGLPQCAEGVGIGWLIEADMAVADLQEGEGGGLSCECIT